MKEVAVGQIWHVVDPHIDRRVEVVAINGNWVRIRTIEGSSRSRETWAMARRFNGHRGGYMIDNNRG